MAVDRILSAQEIRASEAATVAAVAVLHLEAVAIMTHELEAWAMQAAQAAAAHALEDSPALGANAFDDPVTRLAADVLRGAMLIAARLREALIDLLPWNEKVQVHEELAARERGQLTNQ